MPDARAAILDRIRASLSADPSAPPAPPADYASIPRSYIRAGRLTPRSAEPHV